MQFAGLLGIALSAYVLLNFVVLPRLTLAWKTSPPLAKIGKAGLLSAVQFVRNLALAASAVYVAFALLTLGLEFTFGHNVKILGAIVSGAARLHDVLDSIKGFWDAWFFLVPLLMIVALCWYVQTNQFKRRYARLLDNEFDRLNREREENPDTWNIEPDARMRSLELEIEKSQAAIASMPIDSRDTLKTRQALRRRDVQLREQWSEADYERRLRLEKIDAFAEDTGDRLTWSRFFISRGFFSDLKGISRLLSGVTLVLLTISLIGVASQVGLSKDIWDRVVKLDDLRVELTKQDVARRGDEVKAEWEKAGRPALAEEDKQAIQQLSNQFARALLENPHWRAPGTNIRQGRATTEALTRRAILDEFRIPDKNNVDTVAFEDGLSSTEHQALSDFASRSETTKVASLLTEREGPSVKFWFGTRWEKAKQSILEHASLYSKPAKIEDLGDALLDHILSSTFEGVTPDFGSDVIAEKARSLMTDSMKEAVHEAVITEFHDVMRDVADGKPYEEAIQNVRTRDLPFRRSRSTDLALIIRDGHLPDPANLGEDLSSNSGRWRPTGPRGGVSPNSEQRVGTSYSGDNVGGPISFESMPPEEKTIVSEIADEATQSGKYSLQEQELVRKVLTTYTRCQSCRKLIAKPYGHLAIEASLSKRAEVAERDRQNPDGR